jgi:hypothetical protein
MDAMTYDRNSPNRAWKSVAASNPDVVDPPQSPWWHALLVPPNREVKSRDWLARFMPEVYLPSFNKQVCRSRHLRVHTTRRCAALPGMLFAPVEALDIPKRREVFDYARVRGFMRSSDGLPQIIHLRDINKIKLLEAKLNLPPEAKGVFFKVGERVRFVDGLFESWQGTIFEIASESRIGVEVDHLFGRKTKVFVPASEIEAL